MTAPNEDDIVVFIIRTLWIQIHLLRSQQHPAQTLILIVYNCSY